MKRIRLDVDTAPTFGMGGREGKGRDVRMRKERRRAKNTKKSRRASGLFVRDVAVWLRQQSTTKRRDVKGTM